jgi:uroporphyrinogen-III synthase
MISKILISQPKPSSEKSPYYDIARDFNVDLVFRPFIKVEGLSPKEFRQQKVSILSHTAVVFTSRHAIDNYFNLAKELRLTIPEDMKYFCVTETISLYIQKYVQYRKRKVFFGNTGKIDDLLPVMLKHKQEKYLVPLSSVHNDDVKKLLDSKGLTHTECVMYRTVSNDFTEEEIKQFDYDMLIFSTPTGVHYFTKAFPNKEQGDLRIGVFGPATAKAVEDAHLRVDMMAPTKQYPSMTSALRAYLQKEKSKKA